MPRKSKIVNIPNCCASCSLLKFLCRVLLPLLLAYPGPPNKTLKYSLQCVFQLQNHLPSHRQERTKHLLSPLLLHVSPAKQAALLAGKLWDNSEVFLNLKRSCMHPCLSLPCLPLDCPNQLWVTEGPSSHLARPGSSTKATAHSHKPAKISTKCSWQAAWKVTGLCLGLKKPSNKPFEVFFGHLLSYLG